MTSPIEIAGELGRPAPVRDSTTWVQWESWIRKAKRLVLFGLRERGWQGTLDDLDAEDLDLVVQEAVVARARRTDDATQVETAVDDARTVRRYEAGTGRIRILPEWLDLLLPQGTQAGAFSTLMVGEPDTP